MQRNALAVGLATLALYAWGMLYWGANPLPYTAWQQTRDDAAAGRALLQHFPVSGTYYLPGLYNDQETLTRLHESGPVAMIHITAREGRPQFDAGVLVKGFVLDLVVVLLIFWLLRMAGPALPSYRDRLRFVAVAGFCAAVMIDVGDSVWWYLPLEWKLHQGLYDWSAYGVAGAVLARFP